MAKPLAPKEERTLRALEQGIDARTAAYKKEKEHHLNEGKKKELLQELHSIEKYISGCSNGEIADILPNIQFARRKKEILNMILSEK